MKIKIGKSNKRKAVADLSYDVSTTSSFGHCQPICCKEMTPDSEFNVEVDSFVRLAPMVSPTFGRLKYKVWHSFVPIADIFKPFENMLAGREYDSYVQAYIPQAVPQISVDLLSKIFYTMDFYGTMYTSSSGLTVARARTLSKNGVVNLGSVEREPNTATTFNGAYFMSADRPWYVSSKTWTGGTTTTASTYSDIYHWGNFHTAAPWQETLLVDPNTADQLWFDATAVGDRYPLFAQKLTDRQKRLRKVLLGLGYQLDVNNTQKVSILPLIAYYKAWFTTLFPQRYKTWTDTAAYKLMNMFAEEGSYLLANTSSNLPLFAVFLSNLAETFYYDDADYITAHLLDINQSPASLNVKYVDGNNEEAQMSVDATNNENAFIQTSAGGYFDDTAIRLLRILTKFVNKNNVIGGKISEYLRAHYNADIVNNLLQNYFIGGDSTDIVISDVMSNAQTENSPVGDYAGYGVGYKDGKNYHFKADTFGYWITFSALVPKAKFYQGIDPTLGHIDRFTFYTPEFDAVGYKMSEQSIAYNMEGFGAASLASTGVTLNNQFGLIPRYTEYKTSAKNIVNGDMSLPSTRNSLAQYTVDKMLTPSQFHGADLSTSGNTVKYGWTSIYGYPVDNLYAGIELRNIGEDEQNGNFDRVFYNSENPVLRFGLETTSESFANIYREFCRPNDNFIVHHIVNINAKLPMIPLSESWYTDGESDNTIDSEQV